MRDTTKDEETKNEVNEKLSNYFDLDSLDVEE